MFQVKNDNFQFVCVFDSYLEYDKAHRYGN